RREQHRRLLGAGGLVPPADQPPRRAGAAQMLRAMHLPVHGAAGLMGGADRLATAGALRRLVHTHPLVAAAFTAPQARRTQPALPLWGLRVTLLGVAVADDPRAAA